MPERPPTWRALEPLSARKLNRISSAVSPLFKARDTAAVPFRVASGTSRDLEIKALDNANQALVCVLPGEGANVNALEYQVRLSQIFTEASRGAFIYAYSDLNNRTVSGGATETQQLTPSFTVGEVITVVAIGVGWKFAGDGRMWAKVA